MTTNNDAAQPTAFKVGHRVRNKHSGWPEATVIELTERGFRYEYDKPFLVSPRLGSTTGGEAYREGFDSWEVVSAAQPTGEGEAPEVKPCNHCGAVAEVVQTESGNAWVAFIYHVRTCFWSTWMGNHQQAITERGFDAWNTRATHPSTSDVSERARRAAAAAIEDWWTLTWQDKEKLMARLTDIISAEFGEK